MSTLQTAQAVVMILALVAPPVLAARRLGIGQTLPTAVITLILFGAAGLAVAYLDVMAVKVALLTAVAALVAWLVLAPDSWRGFTGWLFGNAVATGIFIVLLSTVMPLGNLEWIARFATDLGWLEHHKPMKTRMMYGNEDWRDHHVTSDEWRVQDPTLFWRPRPGVGPYNDQGFKSPFHVAVPKPDSVFRIIAYGDSNTDGSLELDWPTTLHRILQQRNTDGRVFEVINAGVAGYSSYQGLQRFLQDAPVYEPDLIFVSFGWNDVATATSLPDKAYTPRSRIGVKVLRQLLRYRFFTVMQHYMLSEQLSESLMEAQARVSLEDYRANMESFAASASEQGITVVFLTRPHMATAEEISRSEGWRAQVPQYNKALLAFAGDNEEICLDVQGYYELEVGDKSVFSDESHFYTEEGMALMGSFLQRELDRLQLLGITGE